jgi:hypothetical protein
VARAGRPKLIDFFDLAFRPLPSSSSSAAAPNIKASRTNAANDTRGGRRDSGTVCLARGIFGLEGDGFSYDNYDGAAVRAAAATLVLGLEADASVGAVLAASVLTCALMRSSTAMAFSETTNQPLEAVTGAGAADDPTGEGDERTAEGGITHAATARTLAAAAREVERVCDRLQATGAMRRAATEPLALAARLLEPADVDGCHMLFAAAGSSAVATSSGLAATLPALDGLRKGVVEPSKAQIAAGWGRERQPQRPLEHRAEDFSRMTQMWELLKLEPTLGRQRRLEVGPRFVLALLCMLGEADAASTLLGHLEQLDREGPLVVSGAAVAGLPSVPPHRRGQFIRQLHVLCRLRGQTPSLETVEQLTAYLDSCGGLLEELELEWWEDGAAGDGRRLRPPFE